MPKTSHQHFSVALLSKVNDKIDLKQKFEKQVVCNHFPIHTCEKNKPNFDNHL